MWTRISNAILTGPLPNADDSLIVADSKLKNIYQVDVTSGTTGQLLPTATPSTPLALAYHSTAKLVYWTDQTAYTINRYSLLTNSSTVIFRDPSGIGIHSTIWNIKSNLLNNKRLESLLQVVKHT